MTAEQVTALDLGASLRAVLKQFMPSAERIANPHLKVSVAASEKGIVFRLEAPNPGRGLSKVLVDQTSTPETHRLLCALMLGSSRVSQPNPALIQELESLSSLISPARTPVRPLFNYLLTREELADFGREDRWNALALEANEDLLQRKAAIVRGLMPENTLRRIQQYYQNLVANGFLPLGDGQSLRYSWNNELVARWLHLETAPLVSRLIPEAVKPSYCYLGLYVAGAALAKHTDREQCEYTLSLTIDATPHSDAANAWPLYADLANGETIEALLGAGDGLIFKGRELPHYRHELPEGRTSSSIFFHYVPVGFTGSLN